MSKSNGIHTFSKAVSLILIVLLVVGVIGAIVALTNGFQNDIPTFAVMHNDKNVANKSGVRLALGETAKFTVKTLTGNAEDCSVKVFANDIHDFNFTVDGESKSFAAEGDITDGFDITVSDDNVITISISKNDSIQTVLAKKYCGKRVIVSVDEIVNQDYFRLEIITISGSRVFVGFNFSEININNFFVFVESIIIDKSEVII